MTDLLFVAIGMMVIFFVIVGGLFWAFDFVASSFEPAFDDFQQQTDPYADEP